MTLADLQAKYPDLYAEAINVGSASATSVHADSVLQAHAEGRAEGVNAERSRIKEIDDMALPGMEALAGRAKYETGITAAEYAMEIVKAQKEKGINFLADAKADAKEVDDVDAAGAPQDDQAEEMSLLAQSAETAKNIVRSI